MSTTRKPRLKPCPFCGGKAELSRDWNDMYVVQCSNLSMCGAPPRTWYAATRAAAVRAWNTRAKPGRSRNLQ